MRILKLLSAVLLAVALTAAWLPEPQTTLAAPPPAPAAQGNNLLQNGNCEAGSYGDGVIPAWSPWWEESGVKGSGSFDYTLKPHFANELAASAPFWVHSGNLACHVYNSWDPWHAGINQAVTVAAGSKVRLTAWGYAFTGPVDSTGYTTTESGVNAHMQVGIDPNGGIAFYQGVQWGPESSPQGVWQPFTLDATVGAGGKVTVFLSANYKGISRGRLDSFWDDISLTILTDGGAAPGSTAAPTPTVPACQPGPFVLPTPQADGTTIYIVRYCDSLWSIAANVGITLEQLKALNGLSSNVISPGQRLIVKQGAPAQPTTAPAPTVDPGAATTQASTQIASVGTGTLCALLYNDTNGNAVRDATEGLLAGGQFTVVDTTTGAPVQAYTTDGVNEPHCFDNMPAGQYTISAAAPASYNATGNSALPLTLDAGSYYNVEFGAQPSGNAADDGGLGSSSRLRTALFGAAGIMFLLLAAGVAGFLILRRR